MSNDRPWPWFMHQYGLWYQPKEKLQWYKKAFGFQIFLFEFWFLRSQDFKRSFEFIWVRFITTVITCYSKLMNYKSRVKYEVNLWSIVHRLWSVDYEPWTMDRFLHKPLSIGHYHCYHSPDRRAWWSRFPFCLISGKICTENIMFLVKSYGFSLMCLPIGQMFIIRNNIY